MSTFQRLTSAFLYHIKKKNAASYRELDEEGYCTRVLEEILVYYMQACQKKCQDDRLGQLVRIAALTELHAYDTGLVQFLFKEGIKEDEKM